MLRESEQPAPLESTSIAIDGSIPPTAGRALDEFLARTESLDPDDRLRLIAAIWASLPPWHPAALRPPKLLQLQSYLDDYDEKRIEKFPWEVVQEMMADECRTAPTKIYSVPRRFDLATIFVVTLAYSLLFGAMSAVSFPPSASAVVGGFISLVGAAQALLYGGKQPRKASIIAGAGMYSLAIAVAWIASGPRLYGSAELLIPASAMIAAGAFLGYIAGVIIGGVFLVADKLRILLSRRQAGLNVDPSAAAGTTDEGNDPWTN